MAAEGPAKADFTLKKAIEWQVFWLWPSTAIVLCCMTFREAYDVPHFAPLLGDLLHRIFR